MRVNNQVPRGNAQGFFKYMKDDMISGLLVFLIALPLCVGIALASGFPPLAGIFTAIIGAFLTTFISNSEMTIKGPAAGLIVIVLGCVEEFKLNEMPAGTDMAVFAYKAALAVGVVAAVLQILFGLFRAGILGEFFPGTVVHGMLAAIGVIIIAKQIPVALGVTGVKGGPLSLLGQIPDFVRHANPAIALIGMLSLLIMFVWPIVRSRVGFLKPIPAHMIVLLVSMPLGIYLNLSTAHEYKIFHADYKLSEQYLVKMPTEVFGMFKEMQTPDFSVLSEFKAWKWIAMFFIIGSLESLLSAKAIDLLDPYKRKSSMNRDMLAVGVANLAASMVGGLPMISEIVRSRANIDNGAKTRFADLWHGIFLLLCVGLIPTILHLIPLAALAAMLVYTGTRLAHPNEFRNVYRIGKEQLLLFVVTLIVVLATDLLIGVAAGIALKMVLHLANGVPMRSFFKAYIEVEDVDDNTSIIIAKESAVFSNWIPFKRQIEEIGLVQRRNLILDLSGTTLVDASVMEKLEEVSHDFEQEGLKLELRGLDELRAFSASAHATRKRGLTPVRRLTLVTNPDLAAKLIRDMVEMGATGYTEIPCFGAGRQLVNQDELIPQAQTRVEVIMPIDICEKVIDYLRTSIVPQNQLTVCVETVEVARITSFIGDVENAPVAGHH
ncbi:MAG TPA: SulP family inorganic anion transporter [Planctomycetaceae bacterium]|nr:SulP family inorganic anion transporter [Planctomycetaceae bacterium]HQZ65182.1 SulP family inorganic anion transporter [Planctomycetaceae bacterium]